MFSMYGWELRIWHEASVRSKGGIRYSRIAKNQMHEHRDWLFERCLALTADKFKMENKLATLLQAGGFLFFLRL